jgi:hypothetical protein
MDDLTNSFDRIHCEAVRREARALKPLAHSLILP